ncbi:conserved hypothetical protein [Bacillus vallismortis]
MRNIRVTYIRKIFFILHLLLMTGMTLGVSLVPDMTIKQKLILLIIMYVMSSLFIFFYFVLNMVIKSVFHKS